MAEQQQPTSSYPTAEASTSRDPETLNSSDENCPSSASAETENGNGQGDDVIIESYRRFLKALHKLILTRSNSFRFYSNEDRQNDIDLNLEGRLNRHEATGNIYALLREIQLTENTEDLSGDDTSPIDKFYTNINKKILLLRKIQPEDRRIDVPENIVKRGKVIHLTDDFVALEKDTDMNTVYYAMNGFRLRYQYWDYTPQERKLIRSAYRYKLRMYLIHKRESQLGINGDRPREYRIPSSDEEDAAETERWEGDWKWPDEEEGDEEGGDGEEVKKEREEGARKEEVGRGKERRVGEGEVWDIDWEEEDWADGKWEDLEYVEEEWDEEEGKVSSDVSEEKSSYVSAVEESSDVSEDGSGDASQVSTTEEYFDFSDIDHHDD